MAGTLACVLLALAGAGCGSGEDGGDTSGGAGTSGAGTAAASAPAPEPSVYCGPECQEALTLQASADEIDCTVGVSWNSAQHPYGAQTTEKTPEFAAEAFPNMEVIVTDARGDASTQTSQVQDMLARGIDVLVLSPADAKALAGVAELATSEGVDVIAADREVDAPVLTYIGSDNVEAGEVVGQWVLDNHPDAKVVELQGSLGASPTIDRAAGFRSAVKGSGIEILANQSADYDRAEGLQVMEDYLQRFGPGEIDVVYAHNDEMALGAIQAIEEAGREDEITVTGVDAQGSALDAIEAGSYAASAAYPLTVREHVIAAAKACADEEVPERIKLDSTLATDANVAELKKNPPQ